jgi:hypothetical protein
MPPRVFIKRVLFFFFTVSCMFIIGSFSYAIGKDAMEVTRDENKTTYTIGPSEQGKSSKTEEEKDKDQAWDMLKKMNTLIDKREQKGQKNGQ